MIIFLSCVKTKANHRCKAEDIAIVQIFVTIRQITQSKKDIHPICKIWIIGIE